jgi:hypothetical protein
MKYYAITQKQTYRCRYNAITLMMPTSLDYDMLVFLLQ